MRKHNHEVVFCINEANLCGLSAICSRLFFKKRLIAIPIASLVAQNSRSFHSTSPHPEWYILCGANLLLPYIRILSVLSFLQSQPCVRVFHLSLYTASVLTAIGMRYYHVPIAHRSKAWLLLYYFGLQPIVLESWITSLTLLRNACIGASGMGIDIKKVTLLL